MERKVDPLQASVGHVANFLTTMLNDRDLKYSTLSLHRSAISAYHPPKEGSHVGQHPHIMRLLKGAFNTKPPQPRYTQTWDVNQVLEEIKRLGPNEYLTLKALSLKLAMLLALTTVSHSSELHKLDPILISDKGDHMSCHIAGLTKTIRPGKPHKNTQIKIHKYPENEFLDVVACMRSYLTITHDLRSNEDRKHCLFLSFRQPHKPVASCSIACWLRTLMSQSGVDTNVFKAHSTRSAAASKAKTSGITTVDIINCANWARASTFNKFYNKPVDQTQESQLQQSILDGAL